MKKFLCAILLLISVLPAVAQDGVQSNEDFFLLVCNYYKAPHPDMLAQAFDYYVNSPYIHTNSIMVTQFFATLLKEDSSLFATMFEEQSAGLSVDAKFFILRVLAEINTPESLTYLARAEKEWHQNAVRNALPRIKSFKPVDVFAESPQNTEDLDRLWGYFWATGNEKAISRVISVLYLWEEGRGASAATGGAAKWALTRNAAQHPKILQVIKSERDSASGTQKRLLQEIVTEVEEK